MSVLSLSDAKAHLNMTSSENDGELAACIDAAEAAIAQRVGPLEPTAQTARVRGGSLVLPVVPVVSLTSVTPVGGTALTVGDLYVDPGSGVVSYNLTPSASFGSASYEVVYVAGRSTVPADLLLAVKELVKHLWGTQRGPTKRPGTGGGESYADTVPGAAYAFPFRVEQLIAPYEQIGFA